MTTFDIFIGALLALSVYELIHIIVKDITYRINSKKRKKAFDELLASFDVPSGYSSGALSYDCDDDCEVCDSDWEEVKPVKKKAVAKKKTVKKAAPKRKTR